jgi:hypothetical protein
MTMKNLAGDRDSVPDPVGGNPQNPEPRVFQACIVIIIDAIQSGYLVSVAEKSFGDMKPDEARCAGDEDIFHGNVFRFRFLKNVSKNKKSRKRLLSDGTICFGD